MRGSFYLFIYIFICLFIFSKSPNDSRGFVRTPDLSFLCLRKTLPMSSIMDYFIYLSFFQRRCWDEHQVRCQQCIPSIREQKKSQFHPFSTTTNFRFKSLRTVFIIIHFIFLEPRHLLQRGSGRKKITPNYQKCSDASLCKRNAAYMQCRRIWGTNKSVLFILE